MNDAFIGGAVVHRACLTNLLLDRSVQIHYIGIRRQKLEVRKAESIGLGAGDGEAT